MGPGLGEGLPQEGLGLVVGEVPEGLKGQGGVLPLGQRLQEGEPLPPPHLQKGLPQAEPGPGAAPPQEALPGRKLLRGDGEGDGAFQELEEFFLGPAPKRASARSSGESLPSAFRTASWTSALRALWAISRRRGWRR